MVEWVDEGLFSVQDKEEVKKGRKKKKTIIRNTKSSNILALLSILFTHYNKKK